jgi:hypothetical protein
MGGGLGQQLELKRSHPMPPAATTNAKRPPLYPGLRRRVGAAAETGLVVSTLTAIWSSVGWVLIAAFRG